MTTERGDGRNIDYHVAVLSGEGAQQAAPRRRDSEGAPQYSVWESLPTAAHEERTYYDRPVLKEPVWIWAVPAYFYVGGAAGAAATLGAGAQLVDRAGFEGLIRKCRAIAAGGTALGTVLLIYDLGRPERFLNMLRVFRPTSPLNIGSWILSAITPAAGIAWLGRRRWLSRLADRAGLFTGALGVPLAGYTALVFSNSAIPAWQEARRSMPGLFVAGGISSAAALLDLVELDEPESRVVHRLGVVGKAAELAAMVALEREVGRVERVGRPYKEGVAGSLWTAGKVLTASSLLLSLVGKRSRTAKAASGVLGTAGAIAVRFGVFQAGKASARDPRATFELQRAESRRSSENLRSAHRN